MASYSERRSHATRRNRRDAPNLEVYPRFTNDLPDVPFPPKFLPCSFDINRLAAYRDTSLIQSYQYKLHAPADVGVNVNLLRPEDYNPKRSAHDLLPTIDPQDEVFLQAAATPNKRTKTMVNRPSFMLRPDYVASDPKYMRTEPEHRQEPPPPPKTVDEILEAVEATFTKSAEFVPRHPTKPHLKPVRVLSIMPSELEDRAFALANFDGNPLPKKNRTDDALSRMENAILVAQEIQQDNNTSANFAAYFLPTVDTTNRLCTYAQDAERKGVAEGEVFEYDKIREFQFDVETRDDRYIGTGLEDYFLFYEHDNLINYTRLERTLKLSQRRGMSTTRREILRMTHNSQEPDDEEDDEDFGGTAGGNGDGELEGEANGTATPVGETVANQEESVATD